MTIGTIVLIVVILVVGAVLLWASNKYIPAPWKWIPIGLIILILIIWFYHFIGGGGMNTRIGEQTTPHRHVTH
jgi:uncharacterized membrane protein